MFTINGHDYYPAQFSVTVEDVDLDSGRDNSTGKMVRKRLGIKRTLAITMPPMRAAEAAQLLSDISPVSFTVKYYDPLRTLKGEDGYSGLPNSSYSTGTFYAGNKTCVVYYDGAYDGATHSNPDIYYTNQYGKMPYGILYESVTFDLIEM